VGWSSPVLEGWYGDMLTLCDIIVSATRKMSSFN
jgi:hypothetical protein